MAEILKGLHVSTAEQTEGLGEGRPAFVRAGDDRRSEPRTQAVARGVVEVSAAFASLLSTLEDGAESDRLGLVKATVLILG